MNKKKPEPKTKTCTNCKKKLSIKKFYPARNKRKLKDGTIVIRIYRQSNCKKCSNEKRKIWGRENYVLKYPEYVYLGRETEYSRDQYAKLTPKEKKNKKKLAREWARKNRDKTREYQRLYHQKYHIKNSPIKIVNKDGSIKKDLLKKNPKTK